MAWGNGLSQRRCSQRHWCVLARGLWEGVRTVFSLFESFSRGGISLRPAVRNPSSRSPAQCEVLSLSLTMVWSAPQLLHKWEKFGLAFIVQMFVRLCRGLFRVQGFGFKSAQYTLETSLALLFLITLTTACGIALQTDSQTLICCC